MRQPLDLDNWSQPEPPNSTPLRQPMNLDDWNSEVSPAIVYDSGNVGESATRPSRSDSYNNGHSFLGARTLSSSEPRARSPARPSTSSPMASRERYNHVSIPSRYGREQTNGHTVVVDINSNNVLHTSAIGVGNTHSVSGTYDSYEDTESSLSSSSSDGDSKAGHSWTRNSGRPQSSVPHRQNVSESRGAVSSGDQSCPGYVVEAYRLGDGTMYSSAHACEHNNARCQSLRQQYGIEDIRDIISEGSTPTRETPSRTEPELPELLREELHYEDRGEQRQDLPPPYHPPPSQAAPANIEITSTGFGEDHSGTGFSGFQVVDAGSGHASQSITINGNNIEISNRVFLGGHSNRGSDFLPGFRGPSRRASVGPASFINIRQGRTSVNFPQQAMNMPAFPDMSGMSQWIEQMVQQPLRAAGVFTQQVSQPGSNLSGGWHTHVSINDRGIHSYHINGGQRGNMHIGRTNLPNGNARNRR